MNNEIYSNFHFVSFIKPAIESYYLYYDNDHKAHI